MNPTSPPMTEHRICLEKTRQVLEQGIADRLQVGAQLYVSKDLEPGTDLVLGERSPGKPMTAETLNIWLSSTKPITALAIAQLWERELLDLDDPVARHLPEFGAHGKDRITLRHILTHTGGIRMLNIGWPNASWEEILQAIYSRRPEPRWVPGQKAGYHLASSWFVLGEIVQRLDGRPFPRYVREAIFEPLGMEDSWIGMPLERFRAYGDRIGWMYSTEGETPAPRGWHREPHVVGCSPGGNGYGPIRELGRFYEMLLSGGELDGHRLISPQTVEALTTPHRVGMYDHTFKHKLDWGLGFIVNSEHYGAELAPYGYGRHASRRTFGHSGFQSSTAFADPEHRLVVALVVNGNPGEERHNERFRPIVEAIYEDLQLVPEAASG